MSYSFSSRDEFPYGRTERVRARPVLLGETEAADPKRRPVFGRAAAPAVLAAAFSLANAWDLAWDRARGFVELCDCTDDWGGGSELLPSKHYDPTERDARDCVLLGYSPLHHLARPSTEAATLWSGSPPSEAEVEVFRRDALGALGRRGFAPLGKWVRPLPYFWEGLSELASVLCDAKQLLQHPSGHVDAHAKGVVMTLVAVERLLVELTFLGREDEPPDLPRLIWLREAFQRLERALDALAPDALAALVRALRPLGVGGPELEALSVRHGPGSTALHPRLHVIAFYNDPRR
jgi:hypothetical protein